MPFGRDKSLEELEEQSERLEKELTLEQKKLALKKLKREGLSFKTFGSWRAVWQWVKTH